jgi:hypothetical protein
VSEHWRLCLRHDKNGAVRRGELLAGGVHLAEVGIAGDSDEVAEKDDEQIVVVDE